MIKYLMLLTLLVLSCVTLPLPEKGYVVMKNGDIITFDKHRNMLDGDYIYLYNNSSMTIIDKRKIAELHCIYGSKDFYPY